jgi:hypothetical protein
MIAAATEPLPHEHAFSLRNLNGKHSAPSHLRTTSGPQSCRKMAQDRLQNPWIDQGSLPLMRGWVLILGEISPSSNTPCRGDSPP